MHHGAVIPGEALGPAQLGLWGPDTQDMSPAVVWAPDQALQVPGLSLVPTSWVDALPAPRRHILREPHQALAMLQQLKLQEVAPPTQLVLSLLHVHNALQLVPPRAERVRGAWCSGSLQGQLLGDPSICPAFAVS